MGTTTGDLVRDYLRDPFPHSLLSTRQNSQVVDIIVAPNVFTARRQACSLVERFG